MDDLDEDTKENILANIGELFPAVSDLSFFRQVFESQQWDLEKSLKTIKILLECADDQESTDDSSHFHSREEPIGRNAKPFAEPSKTVLVSQDGASVSNPASGNFTRDNNVLREFSTKTNPVSVVPSVSYSTSVNLGAVPKSVEGVNKGPPVSKGQRKLALMNAYVEGTSNKNPVLRIKSFALEGIKVMVIMRGCPGSGKTYLVQHLANCLSLEQSKALGSTLSYPVDHHIFSADDFWVNPNGKYMFNSSYIEYAHLWNQRLVRQAASEGRSPIFVDNTHTRMWEMKAVASVAVEFGYAVEIIDTNDVNKWASNINELLTRNVHGVHYDAIKRMIERYEPNIKPKDIFKTYTLSYQPNMTPPQRCLVTFSSPPSKSQIKKFNNRFHFVPLKDILALKAPEPNQESLNIQAENATRPQQDRTRDNLEDDNRKTQFYSLAEQIAKMNSTTGVAQQFSSNQHVQKPGKTSLPPSSSHVLQDSSQHTPSCDGQPLLSPSKYIWLNPPSSKPKHDSKPSSGHSPSQESILAAERTFKTLSSVQKIETPKKSSDSNSGMLISFEDDGAVTNQHNTNVEGNIPQPLPTLRTRTSLQSDIPTLYLRRLSTAPVSAENGLLSPKKSTNFPLEHRKDDGPDSQGSAEDISSTVAPSNGCEFEHQVTGEYIVVHPGGSLTFQQSHEGLPPTLDALKATNRIQSNKEQSESLTVEPEVDDETSSLGKSVDNTKVGGHGRQSLQSIMGFRSPSERRETKLARQGLPTTSISDKNFSPSAEHPASPTFVTRDEFARALGELDGVSKSQGVEYKSSGLAPSIIERTWNEPEKLEPSNDPSSECPKVQRTQIKRSLAVMRDKGTDTNYSEILSKADNALNSKDVIVFGNASAFRSASTLPKQDVIKAVATHEKSSMTQPDESTAEIDSGLEILTKMFPNVSTDCLVDLFEKCQNNLHWTANLLMDSGVEISEHFNAEVLPKTELSLNVRQHTAEPPSETSSKESENTLSSMKKSKKAKNKLPEDYVQLLKEFKGNFTLNEEHYSESLKKVRETKFGRPVAAEPVEEQCSSRESTPIEESSATDIWDDDEGDMSLAVSSDLIGQLQNKFGPIPCIYGKELVVSLPVSLARQIYSYALESICQQLEEEQNVFDLLTQKDEAFARSLQEESDDSRKSMSFQEIMDHEIALRVHEREQGKMRTTSSETFASRLSQQLLIERFPNMDPATLQRILDVTNNSLHEATNLLVEAGHEPVDSAPQVETEGAGMESVYTMTETECIEQAKAYHEVASKLDIMRRLYLQKATEAYNMGNHAVAMFYRDLFTWYSDQIKSSNIKAAKLMLHGNEDSTTLDLHYLHVGEATRVLDLFLDESIRQLSSRKKEIFIITGRGLHSPNGRPTLKPVIKLRLKQRGLKFMEVNPGMLKTIITKSSTISYSMNTIE